VNGADGADGATGGIRSYVRRGIVAALVAAALSGGTGLFAVAGISGAVDRIVHSLDPLQNDNAAILQTIAGAESSIRAYELSSGAGGAQFLAEYRSGVRSYEKEMTSALLAAGNDPAAESALLAVQAQADGWLAVASPLARQPAMPAAAALDAATLRSAFSTIQAASADAAKVVDNEIRAARTNADSTESIALFVVSAAALLTVAIAAVIGLRARRTLVLPLESLVAAISRLHGGDSSARVDPDGPAEVQAAGHALNALAERLGGDERRRARIRALSDLVTHDVREHIDLADLLGEAVAAVGVAFDVDRVFVRLANDDVVDAIAAEWHREGLDDLGPSIARPPGVAKLIAEATRDGRSLVIEDARTDARLTAPDITTHFSRVDLRASVISPIVAAGELLGSLVILDNSPRYWQEDEVGLIEVAGEELGRAMQHAQLFTAQRELVAQLQELDRSKSEFLSTVSHELRTPLTSIAGYVEMLEEEDAGPVTEQQMKMLEIVDRNARRLRGLIEDLLTLSRIEVGAFRVSLEPVDVAAIIDDVLQVIEPTVRDKGLTLHTEFAEDLGLVMADRSQLERALLNLLANAAKFTPEGGAVTVLATRDRAELRLAVNDTGIGIPPDELEQLSTRFFRASNATERAIPGTGLGLTIVRNIVEHHGGTLEIHSELGVGTSFVIRIPADRRTESRGTAMRGRSDRRAAARSATMNEGEGVVPK